VCPSVPVCLEVNSVQSTPPVNRLTALSPSPRESLSCTRQLRPCQTGYQAGWGALRVHASSFQCHRHFHMAGIHGRSG
jgi:hypothetical protein